jgi:hypothetical protein
MIRYITLLSLNRELSYGEKLADDLAKKLIHDTSLAITVRVKLGVELILH